MLTIALLTLPLAVSPQTAEKIARFDALGPQTVAPSAAGVPYFDNCRLTIGDVNGDSVPDFVFSNQLGYMEIFCFPTRDYTDTPSKLTVQAHGLPAFTDCSNTPSGGGVSNLKRRSLSRAHDEVLIYDIDLDGVNEIICTALAVDSHWAPEVGLQILDVSGAPAHLGQPSTLAFNQKPLQSNFYAFHGTSPQGPVQPNVASIQAVFSPNSQYFRCGDKPLAFAKLEIVNIRGTTTPQDILVHYTGGDADFAHSVYSYSNGSGTVPNRLDVELHVNPAASGMPNAGEPGHTRLAVDVNGDGRDEVFGRQLYEYVPGLAPSGPNVRNGRFMWAVEHLQGNDKHIDHVVSGEILRSVRVASPGGGSRVAGSPGVELAMCPQHPRRTTGGVNQDIDGGSVWIYRGLSGHTGRWPRMAINHDPLSDWYTPHAAAAYVEPSPASNWSALGTAFARRGTAPLVGDLDPQEVVLGNFLGARPGNELLVLYKSLPRVTPPGWTAPNLLWRLNGSLMGSDPDLTARNAWFNFGSVTTAPIVANTQRNGPGALARAIDFRGTRDQVECYSVLSGLIRGLFPGNQLPGGGDWDPYHKVVFELTDGFSGTNNVLYSLYPATTGGAASGYETWFANSQAADMFLDSREEYVIYHFKSTTDQFARIVTSTDTLAGSSRVGQPSPFEFIDYRRERDSEQIDHRKYDGQHLYRAFLPRGTLNVPYGATLDRAFWPNATTPVQGAVLLPEGGTGPYTVKIKSGKLHTGLQAIVRNARNLAAPSTPVVTRYSGALSIEGTPSESGSRRLTIEVKDSLGQVTEHVVWLTVVDPSGSPASDPRPKVLAGGFDGAYLQGGVAQAITVRAMVADPQNDTLGVALLDQNGAPLGITALDNGNPANGDLFAGDSVFSALVPPLALPSGFTFNLQMLAYDAQQHTSPVWPYMTIEGGENAGARTFDSDALPPGQTQAQTPTIEYVYMPAHNIPPAETSDGVGAQPIVAVLKYVPPGTTPTSVVARIRHNVDGVDPIEVQLVQADPSGLVWAANFTPPSGEFGYGRYSVNVRATVTPTGGGASQVSNWWPNMRWN